MNIPKILNNNLVLKRIFCRNYSVKVLGIETSCDDTAVAIVNEKREILSSERYTERAIQRQQGGINPSVCALQHRENLPRLIEKCLNDAGTSPKDLDAVAVTVTPGLVIALKEGISAAIGFAKKHRLPLIPVHHMRAHALSILLVDDSVRFPFSAVLLSGGHALISVAEDVEKFKLYGQSVSGSPGECIDKVARQLGDLGSEFDGIHVGAAVEILASRASADGHLRYPIFLPNVPKANMNFDQIKGSYLNLLERLRKNSETSIDIPDFCASLQNTVARHISSKLHIFFESLSEQEKLPKQLVIGGGVAANQYIFGAISKLSAAHNVTTIKVLLSLCTDNAEMIAYSGLLMLVNRSEAIWWRPNDIPDTIYAHARSDIGTDASSEIIDTPRRKLVTSTIHGTERIRFRNLDDFKKPKSPKTTE
ncbi:putative tRNA N6-adenosine threonylcarbamoyltransferase, mitochondrial [Caenorhabditis elegans]|uniref:Probable tRNA N6-adenosine threonylcarbamoyltransferase, mitochondrial n=1 Tax=Caenorhabditis elegans TaxID=6239 RepID=OSGP2_CAEEL|nr:putative tRNA N6-adenosine threonylcarbamoyltransferase, mitochondrial [Caenorhabditis elegans]Q93170.2 RecName: Full=Probable tRNA N6-adenosine threonylcarbamoyltransferase, mitochondrial; AltName: Full=N6-L-threonylcarbamoyladenine synthase; Short=t(6)A synthase; AltName: Full=t(6)A37 threonylcarbamoyladenosine biosynthesis protein osgl-1; AltName: Full=tRNA threonylcarbamoyladenosine biosynthesis protein osgl-1; Flags: Precursor [Caenorhabditis elegans]CAB02716.1 Probable tRNA N6-adenosine |eukprot:NP_506713.1 Probable tRNA N6-adenosine threonylcarbamoyltransferase, mitochondrial [Caenorhabditis elegans]